MADVNIIVDQWTSYKYNEGEPYSPGEEMIRYDIFIGEGDRPQQHYLKGGCVRGRFMDDKCALEVSTILSRYKNEEFFHGRDPPEQFSLKTLLPATRKRLIEGILGNYVRSITEELQKSTGCKIVGVPGQYSTYPKD
ncbi:hypothetical protein KW805_03650 [Candidatus Pacearchaeota archaeon]|nr:hypothetical protein [Candidatus Pacearchaeota archaeon]